MWQYGARSAEGGGQRAMLPGGLGDQDVRTSGRRWGRVSADGWAQLRVVAGAVALALEQGFEFWEVGEVGSARSGLVSSAQLGLSEKRDSQSAHLKRARRQALLL